MYKNILVPLDGSQLAEIVLPHVEGLMKSCSPDAEVTILRVTLLSRIGPVGGFQDATGGATLIVQQAAEQDKKEAEKYLQDVRKRLKAKGIKVKVELKTGDAADEILKYAETHPIDLICMASHGRTGITRFAYGSVTSKVLRGIPTPTLVVTPPPKK